ncbi:uncharacterized protein PAC_15523 [Phialocephala subalpina]|uniref:Zn(2)-C6 fungal-type domain-containing protein n=1 Tax=Phialocephala subalpina TaxID=576137 RepID=A0A1L7XKT6_9HELO|nr:uncharacterized protein PAC_15523 [Phialocephala subalpina]
MAPDRASLPSQEEDPAVHNPTRQNIRKRASRPKVRTGCLVCKTRKVKCGEEKGGCLKCLKYGTACPGYSNPVENKTAPAKRLLSIAPRRSPATGPLLFIDQVRFRDDREYRCFRLFCDRTMLDLAGSDDSDLWSKTVLQACEQEDAFRRAVIAIGGLDQTREMCVATGKDCPVGHAGMDESILARYRFALQQYDDFITRMRQRLHQGAYDLRHTLISCILVVCFELFQGNTSIAMGHASTGLSMAKRVVGDHSLESSSGIDTGLVQLLLRLDQISLSSALQSLTRTYVNVKTEATSPSPDDLPSEFASCNEARRHWKVTVRRISQVFDHTRTPSLGVPGENLNFHGMASTDNTGPTCPDSSIGYLRQWSAAFKPLFNASRTGRGKGFRSKAAFLQLRHNTTLLALVGSQSDSELVYDNFVSLFEEILRLAGDVLGENESGPGGRRPIFTFDIGVTGALFLVATKCRDSRRWTAISLLRKYPRREGVWDSAMIAEFASVLVRMEEMGLENGSIPESARVRGEAFSFDLVQRQGRLSYSRLAEASTKRRVLDSVEVSW